MADRVKTVAKSEIQRISSLTFSALKSGAYLYPFKVLLLSSPPLPHQVYIANSDQGIIYLLSHRTLWAPLRSRLLPTLALGVGITTAMFLLTYIPQMTLLAFTSGPFVAPISAALLVINEASAITGFLASRNMFFGLGRRPSSSSSSVTLDAFDATLMLKGHEKLVSSGREIRPAARSGNILTRLGGLVGMSKRNSFNAGNSTLDSLIRSLLYLPLNFIPVIGTFAFLALKGKRMGHNALDRYFELKGYSAQEREEWLEAHEGDYISFGVASSVLEMVPFASFVFTCTNSVGAALWASNVESKAGTAQSKKAA
ncbi:hypothetical protein TCE0_042f14351 [Talaromyces pinophilus]|uniref:Uncharacterized protein n=1 Tax=Talaromyces pinophilus TaxID=128442 RepID=A0A6V8HHP7_TALPI|nr:hypothetical protein TCE0_042f14351 [Talaromyces pinophilus]